MTMDEVSDNFHKLLAIHRRNVATLLEKIALYGYANAPLAQINELASEREKIAYLKLALSERGVAVKDLPTDLKESEQPDPRRAYSNLTHQLLEIDFARPINTCESIFNEFGRTGGAALFVIQNSSEMGGELFADRLHAVLKSQRPQDLLFHRQVGFSLRDSLDGATFLGKLRIIPSDELKDGITQDHIDKVIKTLCDPLKQNSSTLSLRLTISTEIAQRETFFSWFVSSFWTPLAKRILCQINEQQLSQVRFVTLILFHSGAPESMQHLLRQPPSERMRLLELLLEKWTKDEIETWLDKYSYLVYPPRGLNASQITEVARAIFNHNDQGAPYKVHQFLREQLRQEYLKIRSTDMLGF